MPWWNPFSWGQEDARPPRPLPPHEQVVIGGMNISQQAQLVRALNRLYEGLADSQVSSAELVRWQHQVEAFGMAPPASPESAAAMLREQAQLGNRYARAWVNAHS